MAAIVGPCMFPNCKLRCSWEPAYDPKIQTAKPSSYPMIPNKSPSSRLRSPRRGRPEVSPVRGGRCLRRLAAATGTGSARKARSASGTRKLPRGDHRPHVSASWGDHFLMLTTKNLIRCQIPPQQGAAVGVVLSFGADLTQILNLDSCLG
jgi:hypothetical protein